MSLGVVDLVNMVDSVFAKVLLGEKGFLILIYIFQRNAIYASLSRGKNKI